MARLFGTDGVRGVANDTLTPELAYHLGRAAAYIFGQNKEHPTFLIGRDTRRSGTMLADILAAGIASAGGDCYMAGVIPTPAIAYLTRTHHMDAGVMISASHNPFEYNGIKFFDGFGYKLPDEMEDKIEEYMLKDERAGLQSRPGLPSVRFLPGPTCSRNMRILFANRRISTFPVLKSFMTGPTVRRPS